MIGALRRIGWPGLLLCLFALLVNALGIFLLGPKNAARIAWSAAASATLDGLAEGPFDLRIPVVELQVQPELLDRLGEHLPMTGGEYVPAIIRSNGLEHHAEFRYRGGVFTAHFLGSKKSFRLKLGKRNPFAPFRSLDFLNPKTADLLHNRMSCIIADQMGVACPFDGFVFVRLNGEDHGVMEVIEHIGGRFEQLRGVAKGQVPVFKGDFPPIDRNSVPKGKLLWASADFWQYESKADSSEAKALLQAAIQWVNAADSLRPSIDSLARCLDLSAFARYNALIHLLGTWHIDNFHNQWLVRSADTGLLYPVLWDAHPLFDRGSMPFHFTPDALSFHLMRDKDWRLERDRALYRGWLAMNDGGKFDELYQEQITKLRSAVLRDRNRSTLVTDMGEHVYRTSAVQWVRGLNRFSEGMHAHWERTRDAFRIRSFKVITTDTTLKISCLSEVALRMEHSAGQEVLEVLSTNGRGAVMLDSLPGTVLIHPVVSAPNQEYSDPYSAWNYCVTEPIDVTFHIASGVPTALHFFNAVTDEEITPN